MAPLCFWQTLTSILSVYIVSTFSLLSWRSDNISLPSHLSLTASATINEQTIYLFGGYMDDIHLPSDTIYKYNIKDGFWTTLPTTIPSLPIYCYQCTAIINQTLIYIVTQHVNTIYIFDTQTDTFLSSTHMSLPLSPINGSHISVTNDLLGQYMFVISYSQSGPHSIPFLQQYNSYTNQWLPSPPFPYPSHGYTSSIYYNNILFVFGGRTIESIESIATSNRICGYHITKHLWTCYNSILNENKYGASIVMDHKRNKIYIIAGKNSDSKYSNTVDVFDPNTLICSPIEPLPNIGELVVTSILNNQLIVFGGRNVYSSVVLQNVSQTPSRNPSNTPTNAPSVFPSVYPTQRPTKIPSIAPTNNPSSLPSKYPIYIPSFSPTDSSSDTPSKHITNSPSLSPIKYTVYTTNDNPSISFTSTTSHILNYENIKLDNTLSAHYNKLIISSVTSLILFMFCCIYLCVFTSKRTLEIGQMEWIDFIKYPSYLLKIGMLMQLIDIFSNFLYSIYLINYNISYVYTLAWISFICGVIGSLLFVFELMLARKLYSKIPLLHEKLKQSIAGKHQTDELITPTADIIYQIRIRKVDIDIFAILICCFQDIPQITIIIIATCILSEWTQFSILSLMLSIATCTLKLLKVIIDFFGCGDDVIEVFGYKDSIVSISAVSISPINNNNPKQIDAKYMKNITFEKIANASGTDIDECECETEESMNNNEMYMDDDIMSDDSMKAHYRMNLMDDEDEDEYDSDDSVIETNMNCTENKLNHKRPLRIKRKCKFKKHILLMIPEEMDESWSESDFDIK